MRDKFSRIDHCDRLFCDELSLVYHVSGKPPSRSIPSPSVMNFLFVPCMLLTLALAGCKNADVAPAGTKDGAPEDADAAIGEIHALVEGKSGFVPATEGWHPFDMSAFRTAKAGKSVCSVDKVNGKAPDKRVPRIAKNEMFKLTGWVANPSKQAPPVFGIVLMRDEGSYVFRGYTGRRRSDVAESLQSPALEMSGFTLSASLQGIEPGAYRVVLIQDTNNELTSCTRTVNIMVTQ